MEYGTNQNGTVDAATELQDIVGKAEDLLGQLGDNGEASIGELRRRVGANAWVVLEELLLCASIEEPGRAVSRAIDSVMVPAFMRPRFDFDPKTPRLGNIHSDDGPIRSAASTCSWAMGHRGILCTRLPL